jgi:Flp pilus assembly protein TadG
MLTNATSLATKENLLGALRHNTATMLMMTVSTISINALTKLQMASNASTKLSAQAEDAPHMNTTTTSAMNASSQRPIKVCQTMVLRELVTVMLLPSTVGY